MHKIIPVLTVLLLLLPGCSLLEGEKNGEPVARVFDELLYAADLNDAIPNGTNQQDSVFLAKRYIENWVKDQLLKHRAEQYLTEEQMDFDKQIEEYHRSLLIFTYRQKLLQQKLDTIVPDTEIQAYFDENPSNFLLNHDVIKGSYIKVPLTAPRMNQLRHWSWNNREEDLDQMEKYCLSYADKFSDFNDTWVYFSSIKVQFPMRISQPSRYLRNNRNLETSDSLYRYFLHVSDHLAEGEVAPLELVSGDIANIIMNKRKIQFIQELEHRVYTDGVTRNQFEIYQ
jgi:hypothetical protein